jgi:hypothetical protein
MTSVRQQFRSRYRVTAIVRHDVGKFYRQAAILALISVEGYGKAWLATDCCFQFAEGVSTRPSMECSPDTGDYQA